MKKVLIELVSLSDPCSSCQLKIPYIKDILGNIQKKFPGVTWEEVRIASKDQLETVNGIELKLLPVIMINGRQITAGTIPRPDFLESIIKEQLGYE